MRRKKWTEPVLDACPFFFGHPSALRGHWREQFSSDRPLWLEIGCGKGVATAQMAYDMPQINLIAVDEVRTVLGVAIREARRRYGERPIGNLAFANVDAQSIYDTFCAQDGIERIVLAFPNPWDEKAKHHKRRLTHPKQLLQYRMFLKDGGEILLKTDSDALYTASDRYFAQCGFEITQSLWDLHASGYAPNYISEHERLYLSEGRPIHLLIARKLPHAQWGGEELSEEALIALRENDHRTRRMRKADKAP